METNATTLEDKCSSWVQTCLETTQDPKSIQDPLRSEAREFFRVALAVPSVYTDPREASLAKLIQLLGPALTASSLPSRICALSILCGAIEGCCQKNNNEEDTFKLSMKTANLVISFLMEQIGPIEQNTDDGGYSVEDYDEQVRDIAMENLSALLKCHSETQDQKQIAEAFLLRCKIARQGIERRCADPEVDATNNIDHGFGGDSSTLNDIRGGLSTLPRSRRSRCFSLILSSVQGMDYVVRTIDSSQTAKLAKNVEKELVEFVGFACNCLQGESDPRCLIQLLALLNKIQVTFQPLFSEAKLASFPIIQVFDAVAPYYPINFTPPPHDNHGITQKGLRDALMSVLSYFGYDELAAKKKKDTMLSLSLGIVLERLIPMGGDGEHVAESAKEKQEAVNDLSPILFPANDSSFDRLDKAAVQQLSTALVVVHQQASVAVSQAQGGNVDDDKYLADSCRTLISKIAYRLEGAKALWDVFVREPVSSMSTKVQSASTEGRISIAYLACLAASGGPHTLRCVLNSGLAPLIDTLKAGLQDEESATAAAYGVGAFFSSCNVAIEKATENGVVLHPHPLLKFSSESFQGLYNIFSKSTDAQSTSLRISSVRALESVLIVSPAGHFSYTEMEDIAKFARALADCVLEACDPDKRGTYDIDFVEACSHSLGTILGKSIGVSGEDNSVLAVEQVQNGMKSRILVDILFKAKQEGRSKDHMRYNRAVLAKVCSSNLAAATFVIESLLHALRDSLQQHSLGSQTIQCAGALSHALRNGGIVAARAFHELSQPNVTAHDIFDKLSEIDPRESKSKSILDLPPTQEERDAANQKTQEIVSLLLPAYEKWVPRSEVYNLVSAVSKIMPPLSDRDGIKLSIMLPLLSVSLESSELLSNEKDSGYETMVGELASIHFELASYALNVDYDARSRSSAAACLHAYMVHFAPKESNECPVQPLMEKVIMPALIDTLDSSSKTSRGPKRIKSMLADFGDSLNLAAVVGSAAACRGGKSSSTADKLASFFVQLACRRKAVVPYAQDPNFELDLLAFDDVDDSLKSIPVAMSSVAAFGSMLSIQDGRPIWKQRLTHNTVKYLEPILKDSEAKGAKPTVAELGLLAIVCHIVCAGNFQNISLPMRGMTVRLIVKSLVSGPFYDEENLKNLDMTYHLVAVKKLVIASILKLSSSTPGLLSSYIEAIITGLMRAYAVTADSDPLTDITCKLLILQVFERICHLDIGRKTLLAVRPAVVTILGAAMNHPSRMLREAAVAVRNIWYTLE